MQGCSICSCQKWKVLEELRVSTIRLGNARVITLLAGAYLSSFTRNAVTENQVGLNTCIYFLIVLEATRPRSRCLQGWILLTSREKDLF